MKKYFLTHRIRLILLSILFSMLFVIFFIILFIKINNPYKVSIYNYESYLSRPIINNLKKNYSYHVFKNLDEFTRAIKNKKAVAGVHSDYQIAQLILENELKKINFKKIYGEFVDYDENNKKDKIFALYSPEVQKQFEYFDSWIIEQIKKSNPNDKRIIYDKNNHKKPIGFDIDLDGKVDSFYEYIIPYFTLDKLIAYNPENTDISKKQRNNLKENSKFDDVIDGESWSTTLSKLVSKYKNPNVYWTHYFLDNAMIGQFYTQDQYEKDKVTFKNQIDKDGNWILYNLDNFKETFNDFSKLVLDTTKSSIKDTNRNKLVTDGQELVSSIIEPKKNKADIAIMYNGDALDAYYGNDNFASLPESDNISFVRPNYSYINIDGWIISKDTNDLQSDLLLSELHDNLYKDAAYNSKQLESQYIKNVLNTLIEKNPSKENEYKKILFKDFNDKIPNKNRSLDEIEASFFKENFESFQEAWESFDSPFILNFHHINYTPSFKNVKEFIKKWYFLDEKKNKDQKALRIFDIDDEQTKKTTKFRAYQPLSLELKTKMIEYYYEITNS